MLSEQQQRIMGYFIEEAKDHLSTIEQGLLNLKGTLDDPEMANEVFRAAHSVKGGAAMLGLTSIQHTAHRLEDYFKVLKECAVQIDQKLETLLLRVYDTLQDLIEQLQGPFGLTDDKAEEAMAGVEPVFAELNQHLGQLVSQSGTRAPEDVDLNIAPVQAASAPAATEESALRLIFQNDVPARLREMLQVFKQPDTAESRQQLQSLCQALAQPGDQLDLPDWCSLLATAEQAVTNPENNYRTLAPVVIKDIKRAQDMVLAGRVEEITASDDLLILVPADVLNDDWVDQPVTDTDLADLLGGESSGDLTGGLITGGLITDLGDDGDGFDDLFGSSEAGLADLGEADLGDLDSLDLEQANLDSGLEQDLSPDSANLGEFNLDSFDVDSSDNLLFEQAFVDSGLNSALSPNHQVGPEMGPTELNTLADLFEGEESDLSLNWQEEILEDGDDGEAESLALDASSDFSDLLYTDDSEDLTLSNPDDLSSLLDEPALSGQSELDLGDFTADFDDLDGSNSAADLASATLTGATLAGATEADDFMLGLMAESGPTLDLDASLGDDLGDSAADTELDFLTAMQSDAVGNAVEEAAIAGKAPSEDLDTLFADAETDWEMPSTESGTELDAFSLPELSALPEPGFDFAAADAGSLELSGDELAFDLDAPDNSSDLNVEGDSFDPSFDLAETELDSLNLDSEPGGAFELPGFSASGDSTDLDLTDSDLTNLDLTNSDLTDSDLDLSLLDQVLPDQPDDSVANGLVDSTSFDLGLADLEAIDLETVETIDLGAADLGATNLESPDSTSAASGFLASEFDSLAGFEESDLLEPVQQDESGRIADWEVSDLEGSNLDGLDVNLAGWAMDSLADDLDDSSGEDPSTEELSFENLADLPLEHDALGQDALSDASSDESYAESADPFFDLTGSSVADSETDWDLASLTESASSLDQFGLDAVTDTALDQAFAPDLDSTLSAINPTADPSDGLDELGLGGLDDAAMSGWPVGPDDEPNAVPDAGSDAELIAAGSEFDLASFEAADDGVLAFENLTDETDAAALDLFDQPDLTTDPVFESEAAYASLDDLSPDDSAAELDNPFAVELPAGSDTANLFEAEGFEAEGFGAEGFEAEDANFDLGQFDSPAALSEEPFSLDVAGAAGAEPGADWSGAEAPFELPEQSADLFDLDGLDAAAEAEAGVDGFAEPEFSFDMPEANQPAMDQANEGLLESGSLEDSLLEDGSLEDGSLEDSLLGGGSLEGSLLEDGLSGNNFLESSGFEGGGFDSDIALDGLSLGDAADPAFNGAIDGIFDGAAFEDAFGTEPEQGLQLESAFSEIEPLEANGQLGQDPGVINAGSSFDPDFSLDAPEAELDWISAEPAALEDVSLDANLGLDALSLSTDEPALELSAEPDGLEDFDLDGFSFDSAASDQPEFAEAGLGTELDFALTSDADTSLDDLAAEDSAELDLSSLDASQTDAELPAFDFDEAALFASAESIDTNTDLDELGLAQPDLTAEADLTDAFLTDASLDLNSELPTGLDELGGFDQAESELGDLFAEPSTALDRSDLGFDLGEPDAVNSSAFGDLDLDQTEFGQLEQPDLTSDAFNLEFNQPEAADGLLASQPEDGSDWDQNLFELDSAFDDAPAAPELEPDLMGDDFNLEASLSDAAQDNQAESSFLEDAALFGLGAAGLGAAGLGAAALHSSHPAEPTESQDQAAEELSFGDLSFDEADFADDFADLEPELSDSSISDSSVSDTVTGSFDGLEGLEGLDDFAAAPETSGLDLDAEPVDDAFGGLDDMLAESPAAQAANLTAADAATFPGPDGSDDFADLEALLGDDLEVGAASPAASLVPPAGAADTGSAITGSAMATSVYDVPAGAAAEDEFGDLEALLQDVEQTLGGGSAVSRKSPAAANRRPSRRGSINDQTMRVSVKHLDNLNNLVGEMVVNRNTLEQAEERLRQFLDNLLYQVQQLSDVGQRMRDLYERSLLESSLLSGRRGSVFGTPTSGIVTAPSHATGASFDALEMDRFTGFHTLSQEMIELIVRVRESASDIDFVVEETDQVTRNFRQITTQLQEGLTRSRMVPFAQTADRLPRGVRDNSLKYGKQAELVIEGRDTLIDKMIVELLYDPMTHLVNNAIAHGIETPEERIAAGKSPTGRITIRAFHQGNQTVISVSDDGAGINPEKVRAKALAKKVITPTQAQEMTRLDTYDLLFHHGFSTADRVDDLRGRGVGLDVVRNNLSEIRGTINIDSTIGKGTTFTIRLPLTLSISKALCCISNRARIAFPMDGVEDMLDVPKDRVQTDEHNRPCIQWRDTLLPFQSLSDLLRYNRVLGRGSVYGGNQEEDMISIVVLRSGNNFLALQVDQVLGEQEIVIKQLEGPVPKPLGVAGATVLGDGRIMPIADVLELIDLWEGRIRRDSGATSLWDMGDSQPPELVTKTEPTVLIVDDSITVRELLSMTFNKVGYRVEQARDGQEAWEKLRSGLPCDLVFCDIEMPRMDGLELLSRIQKDPNLSHLPIAMLTSRGADRHRQMAVQLGAKGYFTKPYLEEMLLDAAQRMLKGEVMVNSTSTQ